MRTIGTKHYNCFSCGKEVHYVNPEVGILTTAQESRQWEKEQSKYKSSNSSSNCFIATATYDSKKAPEVIFLRFWRDQYLLQSQWGKHFTKFYYIVSPYISNIIQNNKFLKTLCKYILNAFIKYLGFKGLGR